MGSRKQRQKRQHENARKKEQRKARAQQAARRTFFPDSENRLVEVVFHDNLTAQDLKLCRDYWSFTHPGEWTHKVIDLGPSPRTTNTVRAFSHAAVLTLKCLQCEEPLTVRNRTELAALRIWHTDMFPLTERPSRAPCADCREEAARTRETRRREELADQRRAAEQTQQEKDDDRAAQVKAASDWVARHAERPAPDELPEPPAALTLLTMLSIMIASGTYTFGPLNKLSYHLSPTERSDAEVFAELHTQGWIAPTLPATTKDFVFADKNTVDAVYVEQVPWRLAHACGDTLQDHQDIVQHLRLALLDTADSLQALAEDLTVATSVAYLNSLLVTKYQEDPLPEHRLPDAHVFFRQALRRGFTMGQTLAVAWSAAASAVAWGQRTPGLKAGAVPSAAVTNLERRLGFARDQKVPEYDLPHWVTPPANYRTVSRLLEQHQAESHALMRFHSLQQRVATRETEELELTGDLADTQEDVPQNSPDGTQITYGIITPNGTLEFRTGTTDDMKREIGTPSHREPLPIPLSATLSMHVPTSAPHRTARALANPIASSMAYLLTGSLLPVDGTVVFAAAGPTPGHGLREDQQKMLQAAHAVAELRNPPGPAC
ncbi:hypothetical protein [Streptomyces sp. NPDC088557]|uniref:hypothetical protein n=1 Tax=Streptomyces sp. NPDC088557 TaxID=3365867 RepID=UPI00382F8B97